MRGWWREISGLVLPAACGGCGVPRTPLCEECAAELYGSPARRVRPDPVPPGLPVVCAAAPYADAVRAVLLAHKERGDLGLARPLGIALAGAVRAVVSGPDPSAVRSVPGRCDGVRGPGRPTGPYGTPGTGGTRRTRGPGRTGGEGGARGGPLLLVPVPSARAAVRARGHDAARRIALAAAGELRRTGTDAVVLPVLRQCRPVADQAGLTARERVVNLTGALRAADTAVRLSAGGTVVLVDDLITTGASLTEAVRALRTAGAAFAAVVAAPADSFPAEGEPAEQEPVAWGKRCNQ
ncbi:phosphoribosyltransferase family protein [Streptomyces sp. NPDC020875]|uniref:ComF family protein n=1 Tax=Streptomyces sp. NPDC020875 TaxID=3154898 RepID=UPI0033E8967D